MISHKNPRLAGYTIKETEKPMAMFAWLYISPEFHSHLQILNKCYN